MSTLTRFLVEQTKKHAATRGADRFANELVSESIRQKKYDAKAFSLKACAQECFGPTWESKLARVAAKLKGRYLDHLTRPTTICSRYRGRSRHPRHPGKFLFRTAFPKVKSAQRGSNVARASSAPSPEVVAGWTKSFRAP